MAVLTPTKDDGAQSCPLPGLYVDPQNVMPAAQLEGLFEGTGLNSVFVADFLSAALAHERCGTHLYRTCTARSNNPMLQAKYREFGAETERHVEILEGLIIAAGGNPNYVSFQARATEGMDSQVLASTYLLNGSVDLMTAEMAMLDAVLLAETIDHGNWKALAQLTAHLPAGELRDAFQKAVDEVEEQEDEHLGWAQQTRERLTMMQAKSSVMTKVGAKAEELMAQVKNWFAE
jgi:rubrerythrin